MLDKSEVTLRWEGLEASVKDKRILYECDGYCKPGEMLAIMGPSGAGKTTLLSLIAKKVDSALTVSGKVYANNMEFTSSSFFNFGVFVYQNDLLHETLTVRETLTVIANLRYKDKDAAESRVNDMLRQFELVKCQDAQVGGQSLKGISGGEKKRVCIAVEMISRPSLLILDEPTSGLDSSKAASVLKILQKVANEGCSVIYTIHQPSYLLYSKLGRLVLLDKGSVIYQGQANKIGNYMESLGITLSLKSTICDFFMMEISEYKANKDNYQTPLNHQNYLKLMAKDIETENKKLAHESVGYSSFKSTLSFMQMLMIVLGREVKVFLRKPMQFASLIVMVGVSVIIIGLFFLNEIQSSQDLINLGQFASVDDLLLVFLGVQGVCFINIVSQVMSGINGVQLTFPQARGIFYKETSSKKYPPSVFFISVIIVQYLASIVRAVLFGVAVYWINGYDHDFMKFIKYLLVLIIMFWSGNSIGFFIGSIFKEIRTATAMGPIILMPLMMTSGLYNKLSDIPAVIAWMSYISPFRYGLHMMLENQYGDLIIPLRDGTTFNYKEYLSIEIGFWENYLIMVGVTAFFLILTFIVLKKLSYQVTA